MNTWSNSANKNTIVVVHNSQFSYAPSHAHMYIFVLISHVNVSTPRLVGRPIIAHHHLICFLFFFFHTIRAPVVPCRQGAGTLDEKRSCASNWKKCFDRYKQSRVLGRRLLQVAGTNRGRLVPVQASVHLNFLREYGKFSPMFLTQNGPEGRHSHEVVQGLIFVADGSGYCTCRKVVILVEVFLNAYLHLGVSPVLTYKLARPTPGSTSSAVGSTFESAKTDTFFAVPHGKKKIVSTNTTDSGFMDGFDDAEVSLGIKNDGGNVSSSRVVHISDCTKPGHGDALGTLPSIGSEKYTNHA